MHHRGQFYTFRTNVSKPAFVSVTRVAGLRINVLDVPEVAQAGHTVRLTCDYDLERARLYQVKVYPAVKCSKSVAFKFSVQVKWYKGSHEFFRYSPFDEQKIKVFTVEGLNIDVRIDLLA